MKVYCKYCLELLLGQTFILNANWNEENLHSYSLGVDRKHFFSHMMKHQQAKGHRIFKK